MNTNIPKPNKNAKINPLNINENLPSAEILDYIKEHYPINIWDIAKAFNINRNQLYFLLRDFQTAGLVQSKMAVNKNNRMIRMIYYNEKNKGKRSEEK
jgi:predicted ArsR family transcriptional regulator